MDMIIQPVTPIQKAITIKPQRLWNSSPSPDKGGGECTRQLEYSNTMVSIVPEEYIAELPRFTPYTATPNTT